MSWAQVRRCGFAVAGLRIAFVSGAASVFDSLNTRRRPALASALTLLLAGLFL